MPKETYEVWLAGSWKTRAKVPANSHKEAIRRIYSSVRSKRMIFSHRRGTRVAKIWLIYSRGGKLIIA